MPSAGGRRGATGSCRVEEFENEAVGWGSLWGPNRGTQVRTEGVCRAEEPLFEGQAFIGNLQVHCQSVLSYLKAKPRVKQAYSPCRKRKLNIKPHQMTHYVMVVCLL